jgi:indolepyruvate decarboxylase
MVPALAHGGECRSQSEVIVTSTVIQYVLSRLRDIGITDVFRVPGDYAFSINDAICNDPNMRWVGCCNELNAAYAASPLALKLHDAVATLYKS